MKCLNCKKEIVKDGRKGRGKNFCSRECFNLGSTIKTFKKGNIPATKGKKRPPRSKTWSENISNSHKGVPQLNRRGEKCHLWKGGITPENLKIRASIEFRLWREAVFARDNWTCQKYFIKGGKLHPHHIKNFAEYQELRFALDNGITLSKKAHREFHKEYGMKNNTQEQLKEFLNHH